MTTPPPDEPNESPASAASEPAGPPPTPPAGPPPAPPAGPPAPPPRGPDYAGFAPVARPPRVPWVNPARRTQLVGWSVVAALLLIGAGFGIGYAVGGSDDDHYGPGRMYHGRYLPYDMPAKLRPGVNMYPMPHMSRLPLIGPTATTTVTVTPSSTGTS